MNIHGIGTDIVNIKRIKDAINKNKNFKKRIFTSFEINACEKRINKIIEVHKKMKRTNY